ncbi:CusA/CzcA family heavy metal efflux RND transporter [Nitrosophilus alvini]|uniref:efflux RND transporter permease subunit n=1 Tax=Nitrosophilus alvini TaxID=2714855 RepID=UPI00190A9E7C
MVDALIKFSLSQRLFILLLALVVLGFGIKSYKELPIDAFPDISPTQVKIIIKSSGMTPGEVESRITTPIELEMLGIPKERILRSISKYGLCDITIDFEEGTDIYWARQQVSERLNAIKDELPKNIEGGLAPISTPLSDILMFTIESDKLSLMEKRSILDWVIAPKIRSISGVAEVNSLGGFVKTYQVTPKLKQLEAYGISMDTLYRALDENNINDGAGRVTVGPESLYVRSVGRIKDIDDIKSRPVINIDGKVVTVGDIADVSIGHLTRAGFVTKDGKGEAVEGIVLSLKGANAAKVLENVKKELKKIEKVLPEGTSIKILYDRSELVDIATHTVKKALIEAVILIVVILLLMLGNIASAVSVALILPFALLMSFIAMKMFGLSANLMSLGGLAIAVGMLVDSAVVMVEHITAELGNPKRMNRPKLEIILVAAKEVAPSIVTGVLIIIIVFMPLLTLEGLEGKLFKPVALSIVFALFSSLVLALTLIPVISYLILKIRPDKESFVMRVLLKLYRPVLTGAIRHQWIVFVSAVMLMAGAVYMAANVGKTFMPTMDEGSIIIGIEKIPSVSLDESKEMDLKIQQKILQRVPEVVSIVARTGSDELGLDPMGLNDTDTFLVLKPKEEWRKQDKEWLIHELRKVLEEFPGIEYSFTQPIEMRVSEMLTGVRGDVAINIYGSDQDKLEEIGKKIKTLLEKIPGSTDIYKKANEGVEYLELTFNQKMLGLYNITETEIAAYLKTLVDGIKIGIIQEGMRRIDLVIKGENSVQRSISALKKLNYTLPNGNTIPLSQLVEFRQTSGPVQIEHENGLRKTVVQSNVEGRDLVGFVDDIKKAVENEIKLPAGYYIEYGGEFENQQRAAKRLMLIVPISVFMIFILLFMSFKSITQALLVLVNIPLALVGGVAGLYFSGEYLSVPASVGFIALLGIAILNGVVMVNYFNQLVLNGMEIKEAVITGAMRRLRPVLMTALIAAFGLLPLLFSTGPGSEIQRPLAIVVINGLGSSTTLTLLILPILYMRFVKGLNR